MPSIPWFLILEVIAGVMLFSILIVAITRYRRCPPDKILVICGRTGKGQSAKCIHGGAAFIWPILQNYKYLSLQPLSIDIDLKSALSKENIRVNVPAQFTLGISTEPAIMQAAAERLLSMGEKEITRQSAEIIFGQMRATIATMGIVEINADRKTFEEKIQENVEVELKKIGLKLINVNIRDITDESGYIDAIGKRAAAEAINKAKVEVAQQEKFGNIGNAEAERDSAIKVAEAQRSAKVVQAENEAQIANAERDRDVKKQTYQAEVNAETSRTLQAGPKADAVARQGVIVEETKVEEAHQKALVDVQIQKIAVAEKEEIANKVVPAQKAADAAEAVADGERRALIKASEGQKQSEINLAEGEKMKRQLEGAGEAAKIKAIGEAEGDKIRAIKLAEAAGIQAKGLAEAMAIDKKAEAMAKLDQSGRLLMILEAMPSVIESMAPVMAEIAKPMSAIDKVVVIDQGDGKAVSRFAGNGPALLFGLFNKLKETGLNVDGLLDKLGISQDVLAGVSEDQQPEETPPTPAEEELTSEAETIAN